MDKCQRATEAHYNRLREQIKREFCEQDLNYLEELVLDVCQKEHDYTMFYTLPTRLYYLCELLSEWRMRNRESNIHTIINDNFANCMIIDKEGGNYYDTRRI